jgi:hypothetical protein
MFYSIFMPTPTLIYEGVYEGVGVGEYRVKHNKTYYMRVRPGGI